MKRWLAASLLLTGCAVHLPPAAEKAPPPAERAICPSPPPPPKPVWPDRCAEDWYARAELPACVKEWIVDLTAQQKAIAKKQKRK